MPDKPAPQNDQPEAGLPVTGPPDPGLPENQAAPVAPRPGSKAATKAAKKIKSPLLDRIDSLFADLKDQVEEAPQQAESAAVPPKKIPEAPELASESANESAQPVPRKTTKPLPPTSTKPQAKQQTKPFTATPGRSSGRRSTRPLPPLHAGEKQGLQPKSARMTGRLKGFALDRGEIRQTGAPVTPAGMESLRRGGAIYLNSHELDRQPELGDQGITSLMAVPFKLHQDNQGLLEILDDTPGRIWNEDEQRLVEQVTDQLSLALENARLFKETQDALSEAENRRQIADTLREIASTVGSSLEMEDVVDRMLDQLPNLIPFNSATIQLVVEGRRQLIGGRGLNFRSGRDASGLLRAIESDPLIYEVYRTQKPLVISNTQNDPRWESGSEIAHIKSWLGAPLIAGSEVMGFLIVDSTYPGAYTAETADLAVAFAAQASAAIRNARLFQQVQDALSETDALYQASAELNTVQTYEDILNVLRRSTILGHVGLAYAALNLFDRPWVGEERPDTNIVIARYQREQETGKTLLLDDRAPMNTWDKADQYLLPDRPVLIEDALNSPLLDSASVKKYIEQIESKSILFIPLNAGGQWIGYLCGAYSQPMTFSAKVIRPLQALASQAAVAIQNVRLYDETRRRAAQLETAAEIARDTSGTLALDILLNRAVNLIRDRYGYYHASIFLIDDTGRSAVVRESTGIAGQEMKSRGHSLLVGSPSVIGRVTQSGETLVINDVSQSPIHWPNPLLPETCSEMAIPLKIGNRIIGALDVQSTSYDAFMTDDVAVLQVLADQIAVAVDNAQSYELAQQAISETAQRVQELSTIYDVSSAVSSAAMQTQEIAQIIVNRFASLLPVDQATLYLLERPEEEEPDPRRPASAPKFAAFIGPASLRVLATVTSGTRLQKSEVVPNEILPLENFPFIENVIQSSRPIVLQADPSLPNETGGQRLFADPRQYMHKTGLRTLVLIPLTVKAQTIGVVELQAQSLMINPTPGQLNLIMTIANAAAIALENANLYEQQIRTSEQLREVDKLKSQFLANMSHELRTPLNSIIGFSRVILKGIDGPISDVQQQDLTAIHNAGTHLLQLINDVLDISKIEAGKMELAFDDSVNIADLVNSAMSTAIGLTKDKPIRLERNIEPNLPLVHADATRIRQVLINFLSNAAKFTDEGSIAVSVKRSVSSEGKPEILVSVTDTGPGISPLDQARLFQPFTQVDSSPTRRVGGTGLGLSISRLLIELHNGRIGVNSEPGKGSTFYFTIPLSAEFRLKLPGEGRTGPLLSSRVTPDEVAQIMEPGAEALADSGLTKILVIDDDRQVINLYERYLKDLGYQVFNQSDPLQALETARMVKPFAITLDIMMPLKDGWQVLEELKADPITRDIPVIICSIVAEQDKAFSLGAVDYLSKPILGEDLARSMDRLNADGLIHDVLIIDDDPNALELVRKSLVENKNYQVRAALGGVEGLVAIQSKTPQAVILDLFMPDLDGFAVLESLRQEPETRDIPVIVFSANDLTLDQRRRISEFTEHMLNKSTFKEEELLKTIEDALKRLKPPLSGEGGS